MTTDTQNQNMQTIDETQLLVLGLPSGEKVIADVNFVDGSLILTNVLEIITMADGKGNFKFSLAPFMVYADGAISAPVSQVIMAAPGSELREAHSRQFSKIVLPESSLVLAS